MRVILGIVVGLQLALFAVLYIMGEFLGAVLQGGLQIGPSQPRYSPVWAQCLWAYWVVLSFYHLLVAAGIRERRWFPPGVLLHLGFAAVIFLCGQYSGIHTSVYLMLLPGAAIWTVYAARQHYEIT